MTFLIKVPEEAFELECEIEPCQQTTMRWWDGDAIILECKNSTHYIYVDSGQAELECHQGNFKVRSSFCGVFPGRVQLGGCGRAMIVTRHHYRGILTLTGPVEQLGRLRYINGCSSTLLVSPLKVGDPCMNFLYVPTGINQMPHVHPSLRIGLVISGRGICKVDNIEYKLESSTLFCLPKNKLHSFHTQEESLRIVVYHPDSDTGPSDESHPMLNRTIVDGVPANKLVSSVGTHILHHSQPEAEPR